MVMTVLRVYFCTPSKYYVIVTYIAYEIKGKLNLLNSSEVQYFIFLELGSTVVALKQLVSDINHSYM